MTFLLRGSGRLSSCGSTGPAEHRDADGTIWYVRNGDISRVANYTQGSGKGPDPESNGSSNSESESDSDAEFESSTSESRPIAAIRGLRSHNRQPATDAPYALTAGRTQNTMAIRPEPPQLQARDVPAVWLTMVYASVYALVHSRVVIIVSPLLAFLLAVTEGGWHGLAAGLDLLGVYLAVIVTLAIVMPPFVLLVHTIVPGRRVWALPGGRAVVTARRTKRGWTPENTSARPIGSRTADELFTAICAYADQTGAVIHGHAANLKVAQHYINHYGGTMHRTRLGRISVERQPTPVPLIHE